jgi:putative ABC transport system permease protein
MMVLRLAWRLARGQSARVWLLVACIALGVSARVCVGSFSAAIERALVREARPLLGADLEVASNQPLSADEERELLAALPAGARVLPQLRFTTMALAVDSGLARTVEVRAVAAGHPLYGDVRVAPGDLAQLFGSEAVVFVEGALLAQLDVAVGSSVRLGAEGFRIAGVIEEEPGLGANPFSLGPRVLISLARVADTGLDAGGARLRHARLIAMEPQQVAGVVEALRERWQLPERSPTGFGGRIENERGLGLRTAAQASASTARIYDRVGDFLRVIALAALLLGGIGVASLVRGYVAEQRDTVAMLQVLGATPGRVTTIFLIQSGILGLVGGVIGAVAGALLQNLALLAARSYLPVPADLGIDVAAMAWGVVLGAGVAVCFAAVALAGMHGLRPAAVLRGDQASSAGWWRTLAVSAAVTAAVMVLAAVEARSWRTGPAVVAALMVGGLVTAAMGWILLRLPGMATRGLRGRWFGLRHGLRNLTRPGFRPLAAVVAIAAAAQLLAAMATYRASVSADLAAGAGNNRPGWFCIDLQSDQVQEFTTFVREKYGVEVDTSPMVRARLRTINGSEPEMAEGRSRATREAERGQFMRGREQRLSWRDQLGPDETIVAGHWMGDDPMLIEASLEQRFAKDIGARLGDVLSFDIQGVPLQATVTSIRAVRWANLRPNFFILLSPHALGDAPQSWVAAIPRITDARAAGLVGALTIRFPNLTVFDVGEIGERLGTVVEHIGLTVRLLGYFCLAAGMLVLVGIGIGTAWARRSDAALLAVLGGTRRTLALSIIGEFAALGLIAGGCGLLLGLLHARVVLATMFELQLVVPWMELGLLLGAIVTVGMAAGLIACRQVFTLRPLAVLREE